MLSDQRRSKREHQTDAILWRIKGGDAYQVGLLLERSAEGLAVASRGTDVPEEGSSLELLETKAAHCREPIAAVARRVVHVHDDMWVIAVEMDVVRGASMIEARAMASAPLDPAELQELLCAAEA